MKANKFRFRCFDGQIEYMVYNVLPVTDRVYYVIVDEDKCQLEERWGEPEYEQSTGRSDANGVEVFDGDIIEAPHDYGPAGFKTERAAVHWDNLHGYQWEYWQVMKMVVIGNIHDNAELLNENA